MAEVLFCCLDDVLYDPKTQLIYTPNTNAYVKMGEAVKDLPNDELRFNENHDENGRFASGDGGGTASVNSSQKSNEKSAEGVDKSVKSGTIKKRPKSMKIGKKERIRLNHQIATDFPDLKPDGEFHNYENRNHFYRFTVNGFGSYNYHYKIRIEGNEDFINNIRKKGKQWLN